MLRDYQARLLADMSAQFQGGRRSVLGQLPTGGGKTHIAIAAARRAAERGKRVLFQAHTRVLVDQTADRFADAGLEFGLIMAGRSGNRLPIQIGSVQSLVRRLDRVEPFDLVITDECHRAAGATYAKILSAWPGSYHIGFSATPHRLDGKGLGDVYEALVCGPSIKELIAQGYLAPFAVFARDAPDMKGVRTIGGDWEDRGLAKAMDKPTITGSAVAQYQKHAHDRQAIAYACSIEHAEHVTEQFCGAGIRAAVLHSGLAATEQKQVVRDVRDGSVRVLVAIGMVSEGFDVEGVTCAILLRPTKSLVLASQQWGRANRGAGAPSAIILDHAGNTVEKLPDGRLRARHGLPDADRAWSLEGTRGTNKAPPGIGISIRHCAVCFCVFPGHLDRCPHCLGLAATKSRKLEEREGELVEVTERDELEGLLRCVSYKEALARCQTPEDIRLMAAARKYRAGWAIKQTAARFGVPDHEAARMLGYKPAAAFMARR